MSKLDSLTPDSRRWLIACVDPFHDDQMQLEGLPDERSAPSTVQMQTQSLTLTAPVSAAGGNWDAKVTYTGFDSVYNASPVVGAATSSVGMIYDHTDAAPTFGFAALVCRSGAAGAGFPQYTVTADDDHQILGSYTIGDLPARLIGVAVEVHNNTAAVYKQGSVTTAMLPDPGSDHGSLLYHDQDVAPYLDATYQSDAAPIYTENVAQLRSIPTSGTWDASEGVYFIPRMTSIPSNTAVIGNLGYRAVVLRSTGGGFGMSYPTHATAGGIPYFRGIKLSGFSPIEAYFTGLSPETTLTVTFRTIVEYFPNVANVLLQLSTPSTPYDPLALSTYSATVRSAPYAVKVGENFGGDYFRRIMAWVSKLGTAVAPLTGIYGPAIAGVSAVASALSRKSQPKQQQKQKRPQKRVPQPAPGSNRINKQVAGAKAAPMKR